MKFLRFIWRNATRSKRRAVLTILSISIAILAISVLTSVLHAFNAGVEIAAESRLVTRNLVSLMFPLPYSYKGRIAALPGVQTICAANWFGGTYQDRKNFFAKFAVEAEPYFTMYKEYRVAPEQFQSFLSDQKGCVVGKKLAEKYGFKVGQTIPIIGDIFPGNWEFNVRGIYEGTKPGTDETAMFFHWKYLDESKPRRMQGHVGFYILQLADAGAAGSTAKGIDSMFENSADQTLTQTEKAFNLDFVKMMGNIALLVQTIGSAVVFALILVAANTMSMAVRERTTEIAILKSIGFTGPLLAALVVAESLLLTVLGWGVGVGMAKLVCNGIESAFPTLFPVFPLKWETVALALGVALFTGAISGLFPAFYSLRTTIVGAMRKVA